MWKYLLIFAVIFGLTVFVSYKDEDHADRTAQQASAPNNTSVSAVADNTHPAENKENPQRHLPRWHRFFSWPEGITAWAIFLTLMAIAEQTKQTAKAAKAAQDSANAAYGSVRFAEAQWELTREKERARLDVDARHTTLDVEVAGDDLVHLIATVSVRNIGASRAFIGCTSGTMITKLRNETLGGDDDYSPLDLPEQFFDPDKDAVPIKVYCFPTATAKTFAECLEDGTYTLHFFGFIEYETLGFWRRKEFGYDWEILERGLGGMLGLSDPYPNSPRPAKDRIAYGYWKPNEDKDRPEYPISGDHEDAEENPN
ncbi:MAG: hypothetical protein ABSD88_19645 [Candidatus Korobacteraceae bacterium]|jgi:hypothetical protein